MTQITNSKLECIKELQSLFTNTILNDFTRKEFDSVIEQCFMLGYTKGSYDATGVVFDRVKEVIGEKVKE